MRQSEASSRDARNLVDSRGGLVFRRAWSVTHELADTDETVLFDERTSELLVLSDSAAAIWYLIDGKRDMAKIVAFLRDELPSTPADTGDLVWGFIGQMRDRGALVLVSGGEERSAGKATEAETASDARAADD
jgi:hypothetical protein